jgi:DNA-directed RNA polymerase specialized sigma24 family protein
MKGVMGRPRRQRHARLEFTDEAYHVLEAAATVVLRRLGLTDRGYVTKEDLISNAWDRTFFYVQKPEHIKTRLFVWAQMEMVRYIRSEIGPCTYLPIDPHDPEAEALSLPSGRELDDPAVAAAVLDDLEKLSPREQDMVYGQLMGGYKHGDLGARVGICGERARQIIRDALRGLQSDP